MRSKVLGDWYPHIAVSISKWHHDHPFSYFYCVRVQQTLCNSYLGPKLLVILVNERPANAPMWCSTHNAVTTISDCGVYNNGVTIWQPGDAHTGRSTFQD
jgi:hypothetical protein